MITGILEEIKEKIITNPIQDMKWIKTCPDMGSAQLATTGIVGRFVACIFTGGESADLVGGDDDFLKINIYNLVTGPWAHAQSLADIAPVLLDDMEQIRNTVHLATLPSACSCISRQFLAPGTFPVLARTKSGFTSGAYAGFSLDVRAQIF